MSCPSPIAVGFKRLVPVGKGVGEEGKGNETVYSPEGQCVHWILCLEVFISLFKAGILGEISGAGFSRISISSPGVPFQGHGLHWLIRDRARGLWSLLLVQASDFSRKPHLFFLLFWVWS